jgi:hypothetical protein
MWSRLTKAVMSHCFLERQVSASALCTLSVRWHHCVSLPPGDVIFAQLPLPLNAATFCLYYEKLTTFLQTLLGA